MLSVARLVSFWRCIPVQYNCQKSSNFQGLSYFSRIFGKNDKIPEFFQAGKTVIIFPGFARSCGNPEDTSGPSEKLFSEPEHHFILQIFRHKQYHFPERKYFPTSNDTNKVLDLALNIIFSNRYFVTSLKKLLV